MFTDEIRGKLENIIRGVSLKEQSDTCTTIRNNLCAGYKSDPTTKKGFEGKQLIKEGQAKYLKELALINNLWIATIPTDWVYLTRGGEASVYLHADKLNVVKVNDGVYYATWLEYFNNLIIHNLLFPDTTYTLLGFTELEGSLHVVLKQRFVSSEETADLDSIKKYLEFNGFSHEVRQDYLNREYGIKLEDMHDENVILKGGQLFFIDTVFYIVE